MVDSWTCVSEIFIQLSFSNMSIYLLTVKKTNILYNKHDNECLLIDKHISGDYANRMGPDNKCLR